MYMTSLNFLGSYDLIHLYPPQCFLIHIYLYMYFWLQYRTVHNGYGSTEFLSVEEDDRRSTRSSRGQDT